jgi:hypothetical protein
LPSFSPSFKWAFGYSMRAVKRGDSLRKVGFLSTFNSFAWRALCNKMYFWLYKRMKVNLIRFKKPLLNVTLSLKPFFLFYKPIFMKNKVISAVSSAFILVALLAAPLVRAESTGSGYNDPIITDRHAFSAELVDGSVVMSWTPYAPAGFTYYKVIRSIDNPNPVYPDDGYIAYSGAANYSSYTDTNPYKGVSYYRVCTIVKPDRYCSPVVTIDNSAAATTTTTPVTTSSQATDSNGYYPKTVYNAFNFSAVLSDGKVKMSWTPYAPSGFNYYKVVRSTTNSDPVYPDDGYILANGDPDFSSYTDTNVKVGTSYYRICSIAKPYRYCSPVATIYSESGSAATSEEKATTATSSITPAVLTLKAAMGETGVDLDWSVDGTTPKGVKVAISTVNTTPTYPVMSGDSYRYLSDPNVRSYTDIRVIPGKTYHYRVCQYNGAGTCITYSNAVSVTIPETFDADAVKEASLAANKVTAQAKDTFSDSGQHLYKAAISYLREANVVEGYDDGTFRPDNTINRAEFMKIVIAAKYNWEYINLSRSGNCFTDVGSEWFAPYICMAKNEGIVGGYPDGSFGPSRNISFVEAAKILAEVYGLELTKGDNWYEGYVKALQENNYIPGTVSTLEKPITRAEMAELIWRIKMQKRDQSHSTLINQ